MCRLSGDSPFENGAKCVLYMPVAIVILKVHMISLDFFVNALLAFVYIFSYSR